MLKIRPAIVIGIGPQARRTVRRFLRSVRTRQGDIPAILPVSLEYRASSTSFRHRVEGIQHIELSAPEFEEESEYPAWLPAELNRADIQRDHTRGWMRAALLQRADDLQEFLLESVPRLSSFQTVEELGTHGISLVGDSEIYVYVIADLNDHLGSATFVDASYLTSYVCQQLGLTPLTTGLLYLPSATSPAPMEEAIAYAALKELDHTFRSRRYDGEFTPEAIPTNGFVPFSNGCYLLDDVNELGYTLQDPSQQVRAASEWLYAMTFLGMEPAIRERKKSRFLRTGLRDKARSFDGMGIAIRYVPRLPLLNWGTSWLVNNTLQRILSVHTDAEPESQVQTFVQETGLQPAAAAAVLAKRCEPQHLEEDLAPLYGSRLRKLEARARQSLQTIRERRLPALDRTLVEEGERVQREVQGALEKEIRSQLDTPPVGGITRAYHFLDALNVQIAKLQELNKERSDHHRIELRSSQDMLSRAHYTQRSAVMSIPPWPISVLGILACLVLPLVTGVQLYSQVIQPLSRFWGVLALVLLFTGVACVVNFGLWRSSRQRRLARDQHIALVRQRLELESRPLVSREVRKLYQATQESISRAKADLDVLRDSLQTVVADAQKEMDDEAMTLADMAEPGPFRSAIDPEQADRFLIRAMPKLDEPVLALIEDIGPLSAWKPLSVEAERPLVTWLDEKSSRFGSQYLEDHLPKIADILVQEGPNNTAHQALEPMFSDAYPLWNYNPRAIKRAKTQRLVLLGTATSPSTWSRLVGPLAQRRSGVIPIDTGDPFTMVILHTHHGIPLFALRRIGEYRSHYAEMLWHSKLPLHTTRASMLFDDLIPVRKRDALAVTTLFATGLALGIISQDADGRYLALSEGRTIRLSPRKDRSVALMSMNVTACRKTQQELDELVAQKGPRAVGTILDEYLTVVPDLEDWEVKGILEFGKTRGIEVEI